MADEAKVEKGSANCICELGYASTCPIHGDPDAIRELPPLWKWYVIDPAIPVSEVVQKYAWNIGEELNLNRVQVGLLGYFIQRRENAILSKARKEATAAALELASTEGVSNGEQAWLDGNCQEAGCGCWFEYIRAAIRDLISAEDSDLLAEVKRKERAKMRDDCFRDMKGYIQKCINGTPARDVECRTVLESLLEGINESGPEGFGDSEPVAASAPQPEKQP